MIKEQHRLLLESAATASLDRIRQDGEKAPKRLKMVFPYLEGHLFEKKLDVNMLKRDCGIRNNSFSIFFAEATGQNPHAYIIERRIETAAALLRDTPLEIWLTANLTGFTYNSCLTRSFKAFYGMTPRTFRAGVKKIYAEAGCITTGFPSTRELRTALTHGPESEKIKELISLIKEHHAREIMLPDATTNQESQELLLPREEKTRAEEAWEVLRERSWKDQCDIIRHCRTFPTPAFFHFLRTKSIPEGRNHRKYGVHLAELATECLYTTEQVIDEDVLELRAQGWAWTGRARRLADDLTGAEEAFSIAETYLKQLNKESLVQAEYYGQKSSLRLWQGRLDEAFDLNGRALKIFRAIGSPKEIALYLIEAAYICERAGNDDESIPCLKEAMQLLSPLEEPYLEFAVCFNLTNAYAKTGALESAIEMLPRVHQLRDLSNAEEATLCHIHWLEGRIADGLGQFMSAASLYMAARDGFMRLGKRVHAALASLDLALNFLKQDRIEQARELTFAIIPLLEAIQFHQEAAAGLKILQIGVEKSALTQEVLQEARDHIERIRFEPWS